jgi:hypothetical protein
MNYILLLASLVIAAAPPPPTPQWDQLTPGVDYEANRIEAGLPLDLSYQLINQYFENGKVLTQTGVASLDAIGARYGLVSIEPSARRHAYEVYWALKRGQSDPYPPGSSGFMFAFADAIDIPAAVSDYAADPSTLWANHMPFPHLELGGAPVSADPTATGRQSPTVTPQPTAALVAQLIPAQPIQQAQPKRPRPLLVLIALGACACLATVLVVGVIAIIVVLARRKAT